MQQFLKFMFDPELNSRGYSRVYMPKIVDVDIHQLEGHDYIKTINAGSKNGHIFYDKKAKEYLMCLSSDNKVKKDVLIDFVLGFRRSDISKLEKLAESFLVAHYDMSHTQYTSSKRILTKHLKKVVYPIQLDITIPWYERTNGHYIINVKTKEEMPLYRSQKDICRKLVITNVTLNNMLNGGYLIKDWCYKGKLLDGRTWDEYFAGVPPKNEIYEVINFVKFIKGDEEIKLQNVRSTATKLKVVTTQLTNAMRLNLPEINGYKIIRDSMKIKRDAL